jgi:hypothetical protein
MADKKYPVADVNHQEMADDRGKLITNKKQLQSARTRSVESQRPRTRHHAILSNNEALL